MKGMSRSTWLFGLAGLVVGSLGVRPAHAQTVFQGADVQAQMEQAIANGQSSFTLPPGPIHLSNSLIIPPGTRNFTLRGQSGSRLLRNSANDFPLIAVGLAGWHAFENSAFSGMTRNGIAPAAEGATTLTVTDGPLPVTGWYAILGTDPVEDVVRHISGNTTYWFRRELVQVTAVNGNTVQLAQPLGRAFNQAELRLIEASNAPANRRVIVDNVTLVDLVLDGRSLVNNGLTGKIVAAGLCHDFMVDDVSVSNFGTAGVSVMMSKGVTVSRARMRDGNPNSLGYGVELAATRFATVRNSTFTRVRTGVIFQSGNMDALVEDCSGPTSNFDVGHGTGDLRLTYRRTVGNRFGIANGSWRRGVDRVLLEDCTAFEEISVASNATNVVIRGKHPSHPQTTPLFSLSTDVGGNGIPAGTGFVRSLTLENGISRRGILDGVNIQLVGPQEGCMLGSLTIRNWSFTNLITELGANINFRGVANSPTITVENSQLTNSAQWSAPIRLGPNNTGQQWNLVLRGNRFQSVGTHGIWLETGARATVQSENNAFNSRVFTDTNVRGREGLLNLIQ